ncbi:Gfo/Idh/MocA family oxidoreductase [bacterium]|nr:Gfo/Idh/MocA family oxidoreductase [bacterium]NUP93479.1 Gfo/Idh/MocA family oxidoreductase [Candidatus Omnitrophota bacterium]
MNGAPMAFGLIGAGGIAQSYLQAMSVSQLGKITAVADNRPEAARAMAEGLRCPAFTSHQELGEKAKVDAVIVCTPPAFHPDIVRHFLEKKIHVLCEKPLCIDVAGARGLVESARKNGVILTMASKFRYVDDVIRAKSIVTSGILGEIILFENAFTSRIDMSNRWNSDPAISGGGVLIDNGTHSVDIMRYFLGPIAEVQAVEGKRVQGLGVEDTVRIFIRTVDGVMGSIDLSWSLNKELEGYIDIYGSRGTIRVGWRESKYHQSTSQDWVIFGKGYDKIQAFKRQIENFIKAIRGEETLLITAEEAIGSVEVVAAAYRSLGTNNWISVAPVAGKKSKH